MSDDYVETRRVVTREQLEFHIRQTTLFSDIFDGVIHDPEWEEAACQHAARCALLFAVNQWKDLKDNHLSQDGRDVVIDSGEGDVMILRNVDIDDLRKAFFEP